MNMDIIIDYYNTKHFHFILDDVARGLIKIKEPEECVYARLCPANDHKYSNTYEMGVDRQSDYYLKVSRNRETMVTLSVNDPYDFLKIISSINLNEDGDW